jgi:hypothetical protein
MIRWMLWGFAVVGGCLMIAAILRIEIPPLLVFNPSPPQRMRMALAGLTPLLAYLWISHQTAGEKSPAD